MRKLEDVVEDVRYGSVLTIDKDSNINNKYSGCIIMYDGKVFMDVKEVELGNFLEIAPNIKKQLDHGYIYQVKYLNESEKYQSQIIGLVNENQYDGRLKEEIISDFQVFSDNVLDSMIELDTIIAQASSKKNMLIKEKVIAS